LGVFAFFSVFEKIQKMGLSTDSGVESDHVLDRATMKNVHSYIMSHPLKLR